MKRNYKLLLVGLLLAFASCSFTTKKFQDPNKDKLLIQLIKYVLEQGHFSPQDINDDFSKNVYNDYLKQLDPFKRYFYASDIKEFDAYKDKIDDQINDYDVSFFNITHERLLKRIEESKAIYKDVLSRPFDFSMDEDFSTDYEKLSYVSSKKEMTNRWRQQLKFSTIANYDDLLSQGKNAATKKQNQQTQNDLNGAIEESMDNTLAETSSEERKSDAEYEKEARETTERSLDELYDFIDDRQRKDWFGVYINAIVEEFDPHTYYFAPEDKDRFDVAMSGNFEGIGARLQKKMDAITVTEIISGGPAWRDNELEVGDQIMKVKQENEAESVNIVGMRLEDAIKFIKGPKGTVVMLTLKRVDGTIEDITITRDVVELEETYAKSSTVDKDNRTFGVINLPKFYVDFDDYKKRNAASDIKQEIERLKQAGVEGIVLDLRNNGGGSLQTVVDMGGLFIEEGPIVQVKTAGEPKEVLNDKDKSIVWEGPLVILVNELSASASEILAAAMQDYKRAIIIGSKQTYGKGTVQNVLDLNRMVKQNDNGDMGALKFTTQKFYRINGGSTQLEGVKSDVVVPDRYSYINIGEKDQENPLPWDKIDAVTFQPWENYYDYDSTIAKSKERMKNNEQLKLIDANAQWVKKIRDREIYSLNYYTYSSEMDVNEEESKRFEQISDYNTNLTFKSLPYENELMIQDSILKEKRDRWHSSLSSDVYMEEAINVLNDINSNYKIKNNVANAVKN
ncbi:tail-specific protease [Subsaximicrobium wynnwilliamsii]|uniref:Tail-specific protease n=1 Tax=Subsaximicrobium wynnwilliamsii TaxID=291179 RepID=A0A5C6ZJ30_9FLAO|nr:carboxy terminal-processing peptidase [Subsaximicrobium wynnwilliamsii]TXD83554.1 tail-specific protease [Subsaximicrobium wynnwilliamsii]TXD89306.1 tail-specific protease [Subsaximicrobium wynnwilliamsii]TXE03233.1 tail-specific protease [Subsaximicrobium wynnwilliamsii]